MTLYCVLVATKPLPTINFTGVSHITVKEYKKLYPITENTPKQAWHSFADDALMLHAPAQSAFDRLNIFEWAHPPYDLEMYNEKPYVYGIEGYWRSSEFLNDLLHYLKQSIKQEQEAELIRFWAGVYDRKLIERHIHIEKIALHHLEDLVKEQYIRLIFD